MIAKLNKHDPEAIWRPLRKAFACMLNVCDLFSAGTDRKPDTQDDDWGQ